MGLMTEVRGMLQVVVLAGILVFFAMIIDLISGLRKARQRGEVRTSYGLSRSLTKFITYEGGIMIAAGMDMLVHFSHLKALFGLNILNDVPIVTCLVGLFLLGVEFFSIKEKADEKTKKNLDKAFETLSQFLTKDELKEWILKRMEEKNNGE